MLIAVAALLVFSRYDRLHVYGIYLREKSPEISTRLGALSTAMDESAIRRHFDGVPLTCIAQGPGGGDLGERVCYASIDKADGDAALTLAAFFNKGKLARVIVQTPWWVNKSWHRRFNAQFGAAQTAGRIDRLFGGPVLRWSMPNGIVETNRDRSFNPLDWNVIVWTGQAP